MSRLKDVMGKLIEEKSLDPKFKDHRLGGDYVNHRECHLEPDWLLIYRLVGKEIIFVRTGTHFDLFS